MEEKTCANCINCGKFTDKKGKVIWSCECFDKSVGMPVDVSPPYNEACSNWTDDPKEMGKAVDDLYNFINNFWANCDD